MTVDLATSQRAHGESGDTLIEVLVALFIMGLTFTVIVGGIGTAIIGAALQQNTTTVDSLIRSAADQVASASNTYIPCAEDSADAAADSKGTYQLPTPPTGFGVSITSVGYWNATTNTFDVHPPTCNDSGLQLITLSATTTSADVHTPRAVTLDVVKRHP